MTPRRASIAAGWLCVQEVMTRARAIPARDLRGRVGGVGCVDSALRRVVVRKVRAVRRMAV